MGAVLTMAKRTAGDWLQRKIDKVKKEINSWPRSLVTRKYKMVITIPFEAESLEMAQKYRDCIAKKLIKDSPSIVVMTLGSDE